MSHNTRTRADLTAWSSPTAEVTPEEFEKLDQNAFTAINGDDGGIWGPTSVIVIGGAGLEVSGDFLASGGAGFSGDVGIGDSAADDLVVESTTVFNNNVTIGSSSADDFTVEADAEFRGDTTIGTTELDVTTITTLVVGFTSEFQGEVGALGGLTVEAGLLVSTTSTFEDDAQFDTDLNCDGIATFDEIGCLVGNFDELAVADSFVIPAAGAFVLNEPVTFSTKGRVPLRLGSCGDVSASFSVETADLFHRGAVTSLTAPRVYTISDTGAVNGDHIAWLTPSAGVGTELSIERPGGTVIYSQDDGARRYVTAVRIAGVWRVVSDPEETI